MVGEAPWLSSCLMFLVGSVLDPYDLEGGFSVPWEVEGVADQHQKQDDGSSGGQADGDDQSDVTGHPRREVPGYEGVEKGLEVVTAVVGGPVGQVDLPL